MFNYVVKDPRWVRLSGQLWIKDSLSIALVCVLELVRLLVWESPAAQEALFLA